MSSTSIYGTGLAHPTDAFLRSPNYVNALAMTLASSAASVPIATGGQYVRLSANEDMFVFWGSTAASTAVSAVGAASEYVAKGSGGILRNIGSTGATTAISVISTAAACTVTASWWTAF